MRHARTAVYPLLPLRSGNGDYHSPWRGQTIASDTQKNLKSGALRSTNSNLAIFLTNANRDIAAPLSANGIDIKKLDSSVVAAEKGDELKQTFEDARLNAVLDRTYAREMTSEAPHTRAVDAEQ